MARRSFDFLWGVVFGAAAAGAAAWSMSSRSQPAPPTVPGVAVAEGPDAATAGGAATAQARVGPSGSTPADAGELSAYIAQVRDGMARRAWVRPEGENVRELLAQIAHDWPDDERVIALRREAAERLLADALALKYAGRQAAAAARVRLALKWAPELPGAQPFLDELEAPPGPSATPHDIGIAPLPTRTPGLDLSGDSTRSPLAPSPGKGNPEP